jgi:hypothetical protein
MVPARAMAAPSLFPSDALTVRDAGQITGKRLDRPLPDCHLRRSDCEDLRLLTASMASISTRGSRSASGSPSTWLA